MKKLRIESIEASGFKVFGKVNLDFPNNATYIVAKNGQGKSTILNAITWSIMGLDMFGNRMDPFQVGGPLTSWVKIDASIDGKPTMLRRILQAKGGGKTETIMTAKVNVDKELFYSLVNPRYVQSLDPKAIKTIISKAVEMSTSIMESGIPQNLINAALAYDGETSYKKIAAVEEGIKTVSAEIKELEKSSLIHQGKIAGVETIRKIFEENGIEADVDIDEVLNMTVSGATASIDINDISIQEKKALSKDLNAYRTAAYEALATEFNSLMKDVQIMLTENGKETFIVTYKGKNVRACSNSEQLLAGLEIINALAESTGLEYPVLVDNAECILSIDINDYPNIKQFVFALVADENLSIWDGKNLIDIETGALMPRSKEQLIPSVKLLDGWGTKAK